MLFDEFKEQLPDVDPEETHEWNETALQPWAAQTGQMIQEHTAGFAGHVQAHRGHLAAQQAAAGGARCA